MTSFQGICKRAGGRRRYNAQGKKAKAGRFTEAERLLHLYRAQYGRYKRGLQARIARELGVSRTTMGRYMVGIRFIEWVKEHPVKACRLIWDENGDRRDVPDCMFLAMFGRDHPPQLRKPKIKRKDVEDWTDLEWSDLDEL